MQFNQNRISNYYIHSQSFRVVLVLSYYPKILLKFSLYIDNLEDFENERFETFDHFDDDVSHHDEYIVKPDHGGNILSDFAASDHLHPPTRPPRPERPNRHVFSRPPHHPTRDPFHDPHPTRPDPFHDPPSFGFNHLGPGFHGPGPPTTNYLGPTGIHSSPQLPPSSTKDQHQVRNPGKYPKPGYPKPWVPESRVGHQQV